MTEPLGSTNGLCMPGGPNGCANEWVLAAGSAASFTQVAAPIGTMSCPKAIQVAIPAGTRTSMSYLVPQSITSTQWPFDVYFDFYVNSQALTAGDASIFFCMTDRTACGNNILDLLQIKNNAGTLQIFENIGGVAVTITTGTLYHVQFHIASGTNNSSFKLTPNAGATTTKTFTATSSNALNFITFGNAVFGSTDAITYSIQNLRIVAPTTNACAATSWPSVGVNFSGGTLGSTPAASDLLASTLGATNGAWTTSGTGLATFTYATVSGTPNFQSPVNICGTSYTTLPGSQGVLVTGASAGGAVFAWTPLWGGGAPQSSWSETVIFSENVTFNTNFYADDIEQINGTSTDFIVGQVVANSNGTIDYDIEAAPGQGALVYHGLVANHIYAGAIQFNNNLTHFACLYDTATGPPWTLLGCSSLTSLVTAQQPANMTWGDSGGNSLAAPSTLTIYRVTMCTNGTYPCP